MSVTEEASSPASNATPADSKYANGDEQGASLTGAALQPLSDPAILALHPKVRYGKDELLKLREAPLSQRKPDFLDVNQVSPNIWDPTRWNADKKKSDLPVENGSRPTEDSRRRFGDPRERIRKENDGIVLSPQRRSFNSGCYVPGREPRYSSNRPHSPLGISESNSHRRIGSGRIVISNNENFDKQDGGDNDYSYRMQQRNMDAQDRRSYGRDFESLRDREKDKDRRSGNRCNDRRRINGDTRDEEPEWFSGGPSSQNDTIELRGFDDCERLNKKKLSPSQAKRARDWIKKKTDVGSINEEKEVIIEDRPGGRSTPTPQAGDGVLDKEKNGLVTTAAKLNDDSKDAQEKINDHAFIVDDILKSDTIPEFPGLLANGISGDGDTNTKSRFSKWFSTENTNSDSRRSSIQDEAIIKTLLKDLNETSVSIPGDSNTYFAPISPAANTGNNSIHTGGSNNQGKSIMDMLHHGKQNDTAKSHISGRIMNLNEIEAKMRHTTDSQMHKHAPKNEDMTAFNRLLAHMSGGHGVSNGSTSKSQPLSLMEMLSRSQQQDEAHARMAHLLGPTSPVATSTHDLASRLQHVQNQQQKQQQADMISKLMNAGMVRASPIPEMGIQQSRELLNRPEAQAILQGLKIGDITPQHLYQQLANPALQPRHREMLVTILKVQGQGGLAHSPRVLSPVAPLPLFQQQQQQQLRVSPLPPNAIHQRIPSPRELQVHTQNILQRALIKKKLEEQQENYRKKQEMQGGQTTNANNNNSAQPPKSVSSPTPLAFTPTSVLRKMTADKDDGSKDGTKLADNSKFTQGRPVTGMRSQTQQSQHSQPQLGQWQSFPMNVKQAGRPIVKANNFQAQQQPEFFNQLQQQKLYTQLQQQQQQQLRKSYHGSSSLSGPPSSHHAQYSNANQPFSQLTQQQLRAQHQQHARPATNQQNQPFGNQDGTAAWQQYLNQPQNRAQVGRGGLTDGEMSPTSNQLTRWFSPDLLERARVGELPSTAGLSQQLLSLEEIERLTAPPVHN